MDNEITLIDFLKKVKDSFENLKSKWKSILLFTLLGCILGLLYSYTKKPLYTSKLTFALEDKSKGASGLSSIASSFGFSLPSGEGGVFAGDNIMELMKSRLLIEKTLLTKAEINNKQDLLINRYIDFNNLNKQQSNNPKSSIIEFNDADRTKFNRDQDSILGKVYLEILNRSLEVTKVDKKLSIISVKVKSNDEIFSKIFCEKLVKNVTDFYIETKTGKSKSNIKLLELRVDSVKRELDVALYGRAKFADQNIGLVRQSAAVPKLNQELKVQMLSTMYTELVKNLEFSKLSLMREEPLIQIIDVPIYPLEKIKFGKLKGIALGGILFSFMTILFFTIKHFIKNNF
jgi:uncharacterized protein involved in exopolysaccharide biosynthesis